MREIQRQIAPVDIFLHLVERNKSIGIAENVAIHQIGLCIEIRPMALDGAFRYLIHENYSTFMAVYPKNHLIYLDHWSRVKAIDGCAVRLFLKGMLRFPARRLLCYKSSTLKLLLYQGILL